MKRTKSKLRGGVSLFVVLFAMLMFTIIAVSFVRLMVRDQQQASDTNLSQSAGDAAQTGVEDGKRAILAYLKNCTTGTATGCSTYASQAGTTCNAGVTSMNIATPTNNEIPIADTAYNEAYTCVLITMNTPDYVGQLGTDDSTIIPLDTGSAPFDTVKISWHSASDQSTSTSLPASSDFPLMADWAAKSYPAILEAQVMQVSRSGSFSFDDLAAPSDDAHTVFLYPSSSYQTLLSPLADDPSGKPSAVECNASNLATGGYACVATFSVAPPTGGSTTNRYTLLRLESFYTGTHFQVQALNGTAAVNLNGVEPVIDATGRASNLFKRVRARVVVTSVGFQYPQAAVDTTGGFCKLFSITDQTSDYQADPNGIGCTP